MKKRRHPDSLTEKLRQFAHKLRGTGNGRHAFPRDRLPGLYPEMAQAMDEAARLLEPTSRRQEAYGGTSDACNAEIIYTDEEREFLLAMEAYKRRGRPFPGWREVLMVVRSLGYRRGDK